MVTYHHHVDKPGSVERADIVVEATRLERREGLIADSWLKPGYLLLTYGWKKAKDRRTVMRTDKAAVDDWAQAASVVSCCHSSREHKNFLAACRGLNARVDSISPLRTAYSYGANCSARHFSAAAMPCSRRIESNCAASGDPIESIIAQASAPYMMALRSPMVSKA